MIDPEDERTAVSRRGQATEPSTPEDEPADHTIRGRRTSARAPGSQDAHPVDDMTVIARRATAPAADLDATALSARDGGASGAEPPGQAATGAAPYGPRRRSQPAFAAPDGRVAADVAAADPASRGRAERQAGSRGSAASATASADAETAEDLSVTQPREVPAAPARIAKAPAADRAAYGARPLPPPAALRAAPPSRQPQPFVDTAAADANRRRRRRARAIVVVTAASVVLIAAVLALAILLTSG